MQLHLTSDGIDAMTFCATTSAKLNFKKVVFGSGAKSTDGIEKPFSEQPDGVSISGFTRNGAFVTFRATFLNTAFERETKVTEAGIYIIDPEDSTKEILFACGNTTWDKGTYIPAGTDYVLSITINLAVYIGNDTDATIVVSPASLVTVEAFDEYKDEAEDTFATKTALAALETRMTATEKKIDLLADWASISIAVTWSATDGEGGDNTYGYLTVSEASGTWADGAAVIFAALPEYVESSDLDCYAVFTVNSSTKEVAIALYCYETPTEPDSSWGNNYITIDGLQDGAYTGKAYTRKSTTAADVGLGNVTNESKATMFTNPSFSGTTNTQILNVGTGIIRLYRSNTSSTSEELTYDDVVALKALLNNQ